MRAHQSTHICSHLFTCTKTKVIHSWRRIVTNGSHVKRRMKGAKGVQTSYVFSMDICGNGGFSIFFFSFLLSSPSSLSILYVFGIQGIYTPSMVAFLEIILLLPRSRNRRIYSLHFLLIRVMR
ncbi:hypothetical protein F5Y08DRAFT_136259 [Xylaria arbuscula]|nr:hypothetical protein F5Y08DRAFT_136259 [Xylaria arbuscula]